MHRRFTKLFRQSTKHVDGLPHIDIVYKTALMLMWTVYCTLLYTNPSPICIVETLVTEKEIHVNKTVILVRYIHNQIYIFHSVNHIILASNYNFLCQATILKIQ